MKKLKSLLLCVFAALRDKNIRGVHHNAPSTLPLKPQAKNWVLTLGHRLIKRIQILAAASLMIAR